MKKIGIIGVGRLGLCFGLTLERAGYDVVGCDIDSSRVEGINTKSLRSPEPGVEDCLQQSTNLRATTDYEAVLHHASIIFVLVHTQTEPDGRYDHSYVEAVVNSLIEHGPNTKTKHLVIGCNINPGYSDQLATRLREYNWIVSYNPELVAQGTILQNQNTPDSVYLGVETPSAALEIEEIYKNITNNDPPVFRMTRLEAEITKGCLNCFLTTKISFANMVGDLTTAMGGSPDVVLNAIGNDSRIGNKFFRYGFGWGGPCFPRDTRALMRNAELAGISPTIVRAAFESNREHLRFQVQQFVDQNSTKDLVRVSGVSYKKGSPILEESQQLLFSLALVDRGYRVLVVETEEVIDRLKELYPNTFEYEVSA